MVPPDHRTTVPLYLEGGGGTQVQWYTGTIVPVYLCTCVHPNTFTRKTFFRASPHQFSYFVTGYTANSNELPLRSRELSLSIDFMCVSCARVWVYLCTCVTCTEHHTALYHDLYVYKYTYICMYCLSIWICMLEVSPRESRRLPTVDSLTIRSSRLAIEVANALSVNSLEREAGAFPQRVA